MDHILKENKLIKESIESLYLNWGKNLKRIGMIAVKEIDIVTMLRGMKYMKYKCQRADSVLPQSTLFTNLQIVSTAVNRFMSFPMKMLAVNL